VTLSPQRSSPGPFETERDARAAAHAVVPPEYGWSILRRPQNRLLLEQACATAGIELGAYDARILDWLAGFEDSMCAVVAGLIARAAAGHGEAEDTGLSPELVAPAGVLPWVMSDDKSHWRTELPDGRTAVIRHVLGEDGESSLLFVPAVYESASDFVTGPECNGVLAAAQWVDKQVTR
jgi:hypothetical protein